MIKTFFVLVLLFIAVVFGQNNNNSTSAPQATADNTMTLFDLYSCAGFDKTTECHKKATNGCSMEDVVCNCKNVNKIYGECFADDKLDTEKCGADIRKTRDFWKQSSIDGCKKNNYTIDGTSATSFGNKATSHAGFVLMLIPGVLFFL
ncbi:hypothetical protein MP638_007272 [Amoeboaphelidium occidentale]|nr:hypothetical protein MP638_007272 [Amoeboaphelidium occidentale]